jgi:hypothetical protein
MAVGATHDDRTTDTTMGGRRYAKAGAEVGTLVFAIMCDRSSR